jgi:hypothetical protein
VTAPTEMLTLSVAEEFVLLSLEADTSEVKQLLMLAGDLDGFSGRRELVASLARRGLVNRRGPLRRVGPTLAASIDRRRGRVTRVIRDVSPLTDSDGTLLVLLAACHALRLARSDRLRARHRIASIGYDRPVPVVVDLVREHVGAGTMRELAEILLAPQESFGPGGFDPGVTSGVWGYTGRP